MLHLVFLGKFRALVPATLDRVAPPAAVTTLEQLRDWVAQQAPALGVTLATTPCKLIVNQAILHDLSTGFGADDEIAFLPPMSGG
jgi:molybdopterin converting factor small subunit